ncbi:amidohydrolase family protein [Ventrimonas sp. CLA-AP-H27]|uniref:Amidohydrolase family protein n=1 Tax=Ventrimonas faecis TaxID=3133170 RepID=A0ABV1HQR1_9FIRM
MSNIILKADRVLVGEDLNLKEHMAVIVRDGKIEEIVPQAECPAVEGAEVIDLKNTTLMPGMIECHNHLSIDATIPEHLELLAWSTECELTLIALDGFRKDLMSGVTTARCMGDRFYIDVTLKKLIEQGKVAGPKLLAAGIGMKGSHGAGYIGSPHCGPEEIRKTARENLKKGVDLLKLFITPGVPDPESEFVPSFLSLEEIAMAVNEAARKNLPVAAHCIGGQGLKDCIDGGVQVIEHMYMCTPQDAEWLANSKCIVDFTSGIFLDPTREETLSANNAYRVRKNRPRVRERLKLLMSTGVPYVLGTDAYHGYLYREVGYAVELGSDIVTALKGVTSNAAKVCGLGDRIGSLKKGYAADIIAVDGNPLTDVECLAKVPFVMQDGNIVKRK